MTKRKGGRKALWDELNMPDKLEAVKGWALEGSTDSEMIEMLGIGKETFYKWKREKTEFADAIKKGKYVSNGEILNSAFKQTTGYYVSVTEPMKVRDEVGAETIELVTYDKYITPNPALTIFMMKNRLGYKDKQDISHSGEIVTIVDDVKDDEE